MKRRVMPIYKIPVFFTNDEAELSAFFKAHGAEREDDGKIAEHLGMNIDFKNSEPVCYIAQWFFETMLSLYPSPIKREDAA